MSAISQKVMLIDSSDWLELAVLSNEDTAKTLVLVDLPQKLNCVHDGFLWRHNQGWRRIGFIMPPCSTIRYQGAEPWIF
jgi:hypothetical protein